MYMENNSFLTVTSTANDGNMSFRFGEPADVLANRRRFVEGLGLSYENCIGMKSDHKDIIAVVAGVTPGELATSEAESLEADALITKQPGLVLMLTTADCQPVAFFDPVTKTAGLVHVSRHTTELDILTQTFGLLEKLGVEPKNLKVVIGPHIKKDSYCFPAPLETESEKLAPYLATVDDKVCIDLVTCTLDQLKALGVNEANIDVSPVDTYTAAEYFSHARSIDQSEPEGRMITLVQFTN